VTNPRLPNYLRAQRRKSGLSQNEVAFLLGRMNGAQVSRYEKRRRLPSVETALACELIFGVPVAELFAGVRDSIGKDIGKRRRELSAKLQAKTLKGSEAQMTAHKLRWLSDQETPLVVNQSSSLP
jgi:transcriptional regulator with XRE-family HTH domain